MLDLIDDWLALSAERIQAQADMLTRLDQAIGDGDHGVNLDRGFVAVLAAIKADRPNGEGAAAAAERLRQVGRTLISTVGGASGPLYGTGLLQASTAIRSAEAGTSTPELLVSGLEAAAAGISALGKSTTGEKTMLDALFPAAEAACTTLDRGGDLATIGGAMAAAAEAGAERTIAMLATKGRASYLGERSVGHQDPGATSTAIILRALADTLAT
jgi:dihydroxyacetone kinase-like protein